MRSPAVELVSDIMDTFIQCRTRVMWSRDNLSNCFIHLECWRREREWIVICNVVPNESQAIRLMTQRAGSRIYALDRSKNPQPTDMGVFTTHVVCYNDDLKYVGMDWFAGEQQSK